MGDLAIDAAVRNTGDGYRSELSPEWAAWGPNGGYIAAILLRAALAHSDLPRAASLTCHFLAVGEFGPVDLTVTTLRAAKRAESVRVSMHQQGRQLAEALIWLTADGLDGLVHDVAQMPDVPGPDDLRSFEELDPSNESEWLPMWRNIEGRPVTWVEDSPDRPPGEPYYCGWYRFPAHTTDDAARQLILLDVLAWSAAWLAHPPDSGYIAPNLDLSVQFHRASTAEWLFAEGSADLAENGLIGFRTRVWSAGGHLLASASGQLICRPT